jgi:hypothetical protein
MFMKKYYFFFTKNSFKIKARFLTKGILHEKTNDDDFSSQFYQLIRS